jgi:hypothetical protein
MIGEGKDDDLRTVKNDGVAVLAVRHSLSEFSGSYYSWTMSQLPREIDRKR